MEKRPLRRPLGVAILSVLMVIAGIGFIGGSAFFFFVGSTGASAAAPHNGGLAAFLAALGAAGGVIFLAVGILHIWLAFGVIRMRNLSRILTILLFILIALGAGLGLLATALSYSHVGLIWNGGILVWDLLALWYLLRPSTKQAFTA